MFVSILLLCTVFYQQSFGATLPASGAITKGSVSTSNATILAGSIGYPPRGERFYPSPPNPLIMQYQNRHAPATRNDIPIPLIGDCVDEGFLKVEVLIAAFGEDSRIRPEEMDGEFKCEAAGQSLIIEFYPHMQERMQEPTYQDVEWALLAIKEASLNRTVNFHEEATIFAMDPRIPAQPSGKLFSVSRIEMFLSNVQTQSLSVTK